MHDLIPPSLPPATLLTEGACGAQPDENVCGNALTVWATAGASFHVNINGFLDTAVSFLGLQREGIFRSAERRLRVVEIFGEEDGWWRRWEAEEDSDAVATASPSFMCHLSNNVSRSLAAGAGFLGRRKKKRMFLKWQPGSLTHPDLGLLWPAETESTHITFSNKYL